ncbi:MAG: co-chaperone GroES [Chloroflexi bacterium]|nr:co-chaperone GroES [Chloroflexota bacterium]
MAIKVQPLADRVLVKPAPREEVTKSGIVLPDTAKEKPQEGDVVAIGPGRVDEKGNRIPMEIKKGDKIIYAKYAGTEIKVDGDDYIILRESDILAVRGK